MKIELHKIKISEVVNGYKDSQEEGVFAFDGKLEIRPKYQREFVYDAKHRDEVIKTVKKDFPLNVMYWVKKEDGNFEVLDGQQRTISIAQFINNDFSIEFNGRTAMFHNLTPKEQEQILNYELMIYHCEGEEKEKLDWFKIINTAGMELTDQELLNAVYTGPWLSDAKLKFSKSNCAAYLLANDGGQLVTGSPIRQEYLETALSWVNNENIEGYMSKHQHDKNADDLWQYFQDVIHWVRKTFTVHRGKEMKKVEWGMLYNQFKNENLNPEKLEEEVKKLMQDDDVTNPSGIYSYVLTRKEKYLSIRAFDDKMKRSAYERQNGICPHCKSDNKHKKWEISEMEADHINPWHDGGRTIAENCQMLCKEDNRTKSGK